MTKTEILAEFDEKYGEFKLCESISYGDHGRLKSFLSTSIESLLKSVEEKCDEMKSVMTEDDFDEAGWKKEGYNNALRSLKSSIKSLYL